MRRWTILPFLGLGLAGCAAPAPTRAILAAAPATSFPHGVVQGRVVDVREVDIGRDAGSRGGVDAVLTALNQPASPTTASLQEVVIQKIGGDPVSIGGAYSSLAVGNHVAIMAGPTTILAPSN